jgi:hypothetical protein
VPKRTSPQDAHDITQADDLQHAVPKSLVPNAKAGAPTPPKPAHPEPVEGRQRRYTGLLTRELLKQGGVEEEE